MARDISSCINPQHKNGVRHFCHGVCRPPHRSQIGETLGAQTFGEDTYLHIAGFFILGVHGPVGQLILYYQNIIKYIGIRSKYAGVVFYIISRYTASFRSDPDARDDRLITGFNPAVNVDRLRRAAYIVNNIHAFRDISEYSVLPVK